jgi:hypothetical protein
MFRVEKGDFKGSEKHAICGMTREAIWMLNFRKAKAMET